MSRRALPNCPLDEYSEDGWYQYRPFGVCQECENSPGLKQYIADLYRSLACRYHGRVHIQEVLAKGNPEMALPEDLEPLRIILIAQDPRDEVWIQITYKREHRTNHKDPEGERKCGQEGYCLMVPAREKKS